MSTIATETQTSAADYRRTRRLSEQLAAPLGPEDCAVQSMPDASPIKWHLAHTTWFFETFVLRRDPQYRAVHPQFEYLFNSYYNSVGKQFPRPQRGLMTRPTLEEVLDYRSEVDRRLDEKLAAGLLDVDPDIAAILELGIHHEQQHQELILTDLKHLLSHNPLLPAYREGRFAELAFQGPEQAKSQASAGASWITWSEGLREVGHAGHGFAYDNESPRHRAWLDEYSLSADLVTCGEYLQFMEDGGYSRPELWLSEGWALVQREGWQAPLYWRQQEVAWSEFTLAGQQPIDPRRPVCHVSYFEADAYARWADARLPTEAEWETAAAEQPIEGNFADGLLDADLAVHPGAGPVRGGPLRRLYGDAWQWTSSSYAPYPGYAAAEGALGEYNGKFMCNQYVLRGGSCATPAGHVRASYRNFFAASARWQFSGVRLAKTGS